MVDANRPSTSNSASAVLTKSEYEALERLFNEMDINDNGQIDASELALALRSPMLSAMSEESKRKLEKFQLNLGDFLNYIGTSKKNILITFKKLDKNNDGKIDANEMKEYLCEHGVYVSFEEADKICTRIASSTGTFGGPKDFSHGLPITLENWNEFFKLGPSKNIRDLIEYWKYCTFLDMAEMNIVPGESPDWIGNSALVRYVNLASGMVAGITSRTATAPLDRLKVVMQYLGTRKEISMANGISYLVKEGGIRGLWRGNLLNCIKIAPETALKFMFYDELKEAIRRLSGKQDGVGLAVYERFLAGSMAGLLSQSLIYPLDVLKTRIILSRSGEYNGLTDLAFKMIRKEGLISFYKGFVPNVIGIIPYAGTDLAIYETLKRHYMARFIEGHSSSKTSSLPSPLVLLMCGSVSTFTAQIVSYPLALVRTRLQAQVNKEMTMSKMFAHIWRQQGLVGFYKGIVPNACKVLPAVSISYIVYETMKKSLGEKLYA
ncbi:hypothetical protein ACOME3_009658 [Neoechinorhynchus agilis]